MPYVWVPSGAGTFGKLSGEVLFLNGKMMFIFEKNWFATSTNFGLSTFSLQAAINKNLEVLEL